MPFQKLRTVREDPAFTAAAASLQPDVRRWDEIMEGIIFTVSQDAYDEIATSVVVKSNPRLRLIFTAAFPDIPSLRILYRIEDDDDHVTLLFVAENPDAEESDIIG